MWIFWFFPDSEVHKIGFRDINNEIQVPEMHWYFLKYDTGLIIYNQTLL